ncbi:MAG: transposase family protein [Thaumarchaeota archaeon]|nr:transposase family protein [Nitrososphaerota archaeon]
MKVSKEDRLRMQKEMEALQKEIELQQKEIDALQKKDNTSQKEKDMMQKEIGMLQKTIVELKSKQNSEDALWNATDRSNRHGINPAQLHAREFIYAILHDDKRLTIMTSYNRDMFNYLYERFLTKLKKIPNIPPFLDDQKQNPGNIHMLDKESALLLTLIKYRSNDQHERLGVWFGVNEDAISTYLKFVKPILEKILPTAKKITRMIKSAKTKNEFEKLVPGSTLIHDKVVVSRQIIGENDKENTSYSDKKNDFTWNTTIVTNRAGLILWTSRTLKDGTHDSTIPVKDTIDLGVWSKGMLKEETPEEGKIIVLADKGHVDLKKSYPGINLVIPKKPKGRELTVQEKSRNEKINNKRIKAEQTINVMKRWEIITNSYDCTINDFESDFSICTGLANFMLLWDSDRKQPRLDYSLYCE